ncbi:O-antigen ligase family protein [Priestia megaterium]|uniref:O-antigen ligase family protein n=1 Tax=Priestia megaterium TaxID=1404 RepID=UPI0015D4BEEC|nr:O-antigen ligase family protein [Priestia megaterium]
MDNFAIFKVLYNNAFVLLFMMLMLFHTHYQNAFIGIRNMVCYSALFVGVIGIFMVLKNVTVIRFNLGMPFITLMDNAYFNEVFKIDEYRYQYTFTHKVRFGFYCIIMIYLFIKNEFISNKIRIIGILLMLTNIMIANTVTTFVCAMVLVAYFVRKMKMNKYLRITLNITVLMSFAMVMIFALQYVLKERNIFTLGFRLPIWEGTILEIKENPFGYIDSYYFHNFTYYKVSYVIGSAHNEFLGEALDYGVIGGIIFLLIYIVYFSSLARDRLIIFIVTTMLFMIDTVLGKEGFAIFLLAYFLFDIDVEKSVGTKKKTLNKPIHTTRAS